MTISLTFNWGNVPRLHRLQIHAGDQPGVLVKHLDPTRPVVANPPDKPIAATPNFAHAFSNLMDSGGSHKKVHAIARASDAVPPGVVQFGERGGEFAGGGFHRQLVAADFADRHRWHTLRVRRFSRSAIQVSGSVVSPQGEGALSAVARDAWMPRFSPRGR